MSDFQKTVQQILPFWVLLVFFYAEASYHSGFYLVPLSFGIAKFQNRIHEGYNKLNHLVSAAELEFKKIQTNWINEVDLLLKTSFLGEGHHENNSCLKLWENETNNVRNITYDQIQDCSEDGISNFEHELVNVYMDGLELERKLKNVESHCASEFTIESRKNCEIAKLVHTNHRKAHSKFWKDLHYVKNNYTNIIFLIKKDANDCYQEIFKKLNGTLHVTRSNFYKNHGIEC